MQTFQEALNYLYARLPMYQRVGKVAYKKDLTNTLALLDILGNPHHHIKTIHIAGTNGKGTSAHALAAILQLSGYKTGLYTSPHLVSFTERIKIDGQEIDPEWVLGFTLQMKEAIEQIQPSFFEVTVAMAFHYFHESQVDIAVIETGLGGRLDSTNVILPEVCLITNIGLDHTDMLGDSIEKIALEKAGIIKTNVPVVIGDMVPEAVAVMKVTARDKNAPCVITWPMDDDYDLSNAPPYFSRNVPGVLGVVDVLNNRKWNIPGQAVRKGMEEFATITGLKGRYQILQENPRVIADVSHNPDGLRILFSHLEKQVKGQFHVVFGSVVDKDLQPVFAELPRNAKYYFTQSHVPRRLSVDELMTQAHAAGFNGTAYTHVDEAKKAALIAAAPDDVVLITGSTFVVAELAELTSH